MLKSHALEFIAKVRDVAGRMHAPGASEPTAAGLLFLEILFLVTREGLWIHEQPADWTVEPWHAYLEAVRSLGTTLQASLNAGQPVGDLAGAVAVLIQLEPVIAAVPDESSGPLN